VTVKRAFIGTAVVALMLAGAALAATHGSTYSYKATMSPSGEVPKPKAPAGAKGLFTAKAVEGSSSVTITWKLTYSGLSGKALSAHIHKGKAGVAGPVIVPLCGPCTSGKTGKAKVSKDVGDLLERGRAYVNVHTAKNQAGEIRGQIKLVGES
jgi:CHRD domain-containing protein